VRLLDLSLSISSVQHLRLVLVAGQVGEAVRVPAGEPQQRLQRVAVHRGGQPHVIDEKFISESGPCNMRPKVGCETSYKGASQATDQKRGRLER